MNDYEHDRLAEIYFHLQRGPVILRSRKDFEETVRSVFTNPARWMDGKRLGCSPMQMINPQLYPWKDPQGAGFAVKVNIE